MAVIVRQDQGGALGNLSMLVRLVVGPDIVRHVRHVRQVHAPTGDLSSALQVVSGLREGAA